MDTNLDSAQVLERIAKELRAKYKNERGAQVSIADDPAHAIDILTAGKPGSLAIVVFYNGDDAVGDEDLDTDTIVDGYIRVAAVVNQGMKIKSTETAPNSLRAADDIRKFLSGRKIPGLLCRLKYRGKTNVPSADGTHLLHGYAQTFSAVHAFEPNDDEE